MAPRLEALEDRLAPTATPFQLYDTGVDAAGTPIALGAADPHYTILPASTAFTSNPPNGAWIANDTSSLWISPNADTSGPVGTLTYRTTFDLGGIDPTTTTVNLTGRWATDNSGTMELNGASTGTPSSGFATYTGFTINSGFQSGINNFDFNVTNGGGPTGLRVDDLSLSVSGNITYNGTAQDDTMIVTATGPDSGTYQVITDGVAGPIIPFSGITSFTFNGGDGDDILRIVNPGGGVFAPSGGVFFDGGAQAGLPANNPPGDALEILGGSAASVQHRLANASDGSVRYNGSGTDNISYTGLEPVTDTVAAGTRTITFLGGPETITLTDTGGADGLSTIDSTLGESVTFGTPAVGLVIDTTATVGADTINLTSLDAAFSADFTVTAKSTDPVTFDGGTINIGTGNANITAGPISFNPGVLSTSGDVTLNAVGASITSGAPDAAPNVIGTTVNLSVTGAGSDIGVPLVAFFELNATTVNASTSGAAGDDIAIFDSNGGLAVGSVNAGAGQVELLVWNGSLTSAVVDNTPDVVGGPVFLTVQDTGFTLGSSAASPLEINAGTLTAATAGAVGDNIFLRDQAGGVSVQTVNAGAANVSLVAVGGAITDANGGTNNVTANTLTATAATGINLDTTVNSLTASTSGAGNIDIDETNGITLTSVSTANGDIFIDAGGTMTATSVIANGGGADVTLTTSAGDIAVGSITASGDTVTLIAAAAITDGDGANDISAANLILNAISGIGAGTGTMASDALEVTVTQLDAENTTSGGVYVTDLAGGLTLTDLEADGFSVESAGPGHIRAASPLTISSDVALAASFTFTAGDSAAAGDDLTINSDATVTLTSAVAAILTFNAGDDIVFANGTDTGIVTTGSAAHQVFLAANNENTGGAAQDNDYGSVTQTSATALSVSASGLLKVTSGRGDDVIPPEDFDAIGTLALPFRFNTLSLATDTTAHDGNQYLDPAGATVLIDDANGGLDAGIGQKVPEDRGHIHLVSGTFNAPIGNAIGDDSAVVVRNAAVLDLQSDSETVGSLASSAGATGSVVFGTATLTTGGNDLSTTWNGGDLGGGGTGELTKVGDGSFRLDSDAAAVYSFTGTVNVNGGALVVNGTLTNSNTVEVGPGILGGTGTLNRPLNVNNGGTVSPGDSGAEVANPTTTATGILNTGTGGDVTFNPGSSLFVDITNSETPGTGYDQLNVTGTVTISTTPPGVTLNGTSTGVTIGRQFRIVNNDSTDNVNGTFAGIPEGGFVVLGGVTYGVTYFGGTGNDIVLTRLGRFDFNTPSSPTDTANGYQGVPPTATNPITGGSGFGWSGGSLGTADRVNPNALLRDLHFNSKERSFNVDVVPGRTYQVTLTSGDFTRHHDRIQVLFEGSLTPAADDLTGATELATLANQWVVARYTVTVNDSTLNMAIRDLGGTDFNWVLNALEVRPYDGTTNSVGLIELARLSSSDGTAGETFAPNNPPFTTQLLSTGIDSDVYAGINAPPNSLITITSTDANPPTAPTRNVGQVIALTPAGGAVAGDDASTQFKGVQVLTDANGQFQFRLVRPTGDGSAFLRAFEVSGKSFAVREQPYDLPDQRHLDLGTATSLTQPGYLGLPSQLYVSQAANALGWLGTAALSADRGGPNTLLRDIQFDGTRTFRADLPNDSYLIALTLGDNTFLHDTITVAVSTDGGVTFTPASFTAGLGGTPITTPAGQFLVKTFEASVGLGQVQIRLSGLGGTDPNFALAAIDIRPAFGSASLNAAGQITITGPASVPADGLGSDVFNLTGAPANSLVTVWSELGAVTTADANPFYQGVQVMTDGTGAASFTVSRPTGIDDGVALVTAEEVTGRATGSLNQTYVIASVRRFDMNAGSNVTQAGFIPLRASAAYTPVTGFGWVSPPTEFDRGTATSAVALYRDGHLGSDKTFQIQVAPGASYDLRLYHYDHTVFHDTIQVYVEGVLQYTIATLPAATANVQILSGVSSVDSILEIRLVGVGGTDPNFVLNGVDIATPGNLPPSPQRAASVLPGGNAAVLTETELTAVVEAAMRRLAATGLSAEQMALLSTVTFTLTDLNGQGLLGMGSVGSPQVSLDDDGAGHGWFVDLTPDDDVEFTQAVAPTELRALDGEVSGRYDLLTVVMHELMHVLGYDSVPDAQAPNHLMAETLTTGTRRLPPPAPAVVDAVFSSPPPASAAEPPAPVAVANVRKKRRAPKRKPKARARLAVRPARKGPAAP